MSVAYFWAAVQNSEQLFEKTPLKILDKLFKICELSLLKNIKVVFLFD